MSEIGSLGYQFENTLKAGFHPGHRRHHDKRDKRDAVIRGIETMRCMVADLYQFSRFIGRRWPEIKNQEDVSPELAEAFIFELIRRERSGGRIGRTAASLRMFDKLARKTKVFPAGAPLLLPETNDGFHSDARPIPYDDEDAERIINSVAEKDPIIARLLRTIEVTGLRVTEATYLRADNIDTEDGSIHLPDNSSRTKGGRPRSFQIDPENMPFLMELQAIGDTRLDKHIFTGRRSLPDRARELVRQACDRLDIPCLGTHGFRKTFAVAQYREARMAGSSDPEALHETSKKLGHNRDNVTSQSYIPARERTQDRPEE
jgi:integrase